MTSIKEALEFYANPEIYKPHPHGSAFDDRDLSFRAKSVLASLESGEARERIARAVTSEFEQMYKDGVPMCMREGETTWRTYYAGFDLSQFAQRITDAILATGLAPNESAIRAEEVK